ncbi:allantoinase AllB [Saxibacter everestensis]|uniref:allantoinase n=1 Tax=Saxibacter everestensis TaxID=2909229 RepID=A0ABY8QR07_9MICO|nr:allantoinase AllB [Brevibacteriaceae bacterium ZFBP1038]
MAQEAEYDLVVRAARAVTRSGIGPAELGITDGTIVVVNQPGSGIRGTRELDLAADETLIPGLVDSHVHVNEPGRTEWEGFASATRAAAAGGVTTIIDMPLNSIPPTTTVAALDEKRDAARDQAFVDVGFWGGAVPGNLADLRPLHEDGVFGFKCFLLHSGVDEFGFLTADELEEDLVELRKFDSLMIVHAEDSAVIEQAPEASGTGYRDFLASRPRKAENAAIAEVIDRARRTGARAHILHLSSSDALGIIAAAKRDGVQLTVETCPHYLTLLAEEIPDGATAFKCCPPIREDANRELLWQGLTDGTIDCIVSDHSPSTAELKGVDHGDFGTAWGGVASLQLGLPLIWTEARRRGIDLAQVVDWMSRRPAEVAGVQHKGRLAPGFDADFSVLAADETFRVDAHRLFHKNPVSPYQGKELVGVVRRTFLRGNEIDGQAPAGRLLRRDAIGSVATGGDRAHTTAR